MFSEGCGKNSFSVTHRTAKWTGDKLRLENGGQFPPLKIEDTKILDDLEERQACSRCHKSRKFFCYSCFLPLPSVENVLPSVNLPIKVKKLKTCGKFDRW